MAKKRYRHQKITLTWVHILPLLFIVGVVPLLVFAKAVPLTDYEAWLFYQTGFRLDFFSYYKSLYFVLAWLTQGAIMVYLWRSKLVDFEFDWMDALIGVYSILVIASALRAQDSTVAWRGFVELHQGVMVLIGYGMLVFFGRHLLRSKVQIQAIIIVLVVSSMVVFGIGLSQFLERDWFQTTIAQYIMLPPVLHERIGELKFTFTRGQIYATMYNTNFVGSYMVLIIPLAFVLVLYHRKFKFFALTTIYFIAMVLILLGSRSRAGFFGTVPVLVFLVLVTSPLWIKRLKDFALFLLVVGGFVYGLNHFVDENILTRFTNNILDEFAIEDYDPDRVKFEKLTIDGHALEIFTNDQDLRIRYDVNQFIFETIDGRRIGTNRDGNTITLVNPLYDEFKFIVQASEHRLHVYAYHTDFYLYFIEEGFALVGVGGVEQRIDNPLRFSLLEGREQMASSRGRIWSLAIPLLRNSVIIGYGPDHLPHHYPQRDFAGRFNSSATASSRITAHILAHNMYVQIAVNTGVLSLFLILTWIVVYLVNAFKLILKSRLNSFESLISLGVFSGIIGYLIAGVFNDQIISVAPVFYAFLGFGYGLNTRLKQQVQNI